MNSLPGSKRDDGMAVDVRGAMLRTAVRCWQMRAVYRICRTVDSFGGSSAVRDSTRGWQVGGRSQERRGKETTGA